MSLTVLQVDRIDPSGTTLLRDWYAAFRAGATAGREAAVVPAFDELATALRDPGPRKQRSAFAARRGDAVVGAMLVELPLQDNLHLAEIEVCVPAENRGQGIGAALYAAGDAAAVAAGRTTYLCEIHVPTGVAVDGHPGPRFAARRGFTSVHVEDHLVLDLPMPPGRLQDLAAAAAQRDGAYEVFGWAGDTPEEHLVAYADLRSAMERDVPMGDLDYEPPLWTTEMVRTSDRRMAAQGYCQLASVARDAAGTLVGYSLMLVPEHRPMEVQQEDTLVLRAHRGHRLGTALKSRNLQALSRDFVGRRRVHTWTAPDNTAMQVVNRSFGFRAVELLHEFQRRG